MANKFPLLIFPQPKLVTPSQGRGFLLPKPQVPDHGRQVDRLDPQIGKVQSEFERFKGMIDTSIAGAEPEMVLVLELAKRIDDLARAVNAAGLEWLGEWDIEIESDDDFPAKDKRTTRDGRLFVSMANQQGMNELLSLWRQWCQNRRPPRGKTIWGEIFTHLKNIRRWGMSETLIETGMKEYFENFLDGESVSFQIEFFYHQSRNKRRHVEDNIKTFLDQEGGETISDFIDIPDIAFHAVKARMPIEKIKELLETSEEQTERLYLFTYPNIMYFRRTGQSITSTVEGDGEETQYPQTEAKQPPIAAILDGVPNLQHKALENRVDLDDPFDLAKEYQPGERKHGTEMASLVIHGDRSDDKAEPIHSKVHHVAVMQVDVSSRGFGDMPEHFPEDCFYEDRIEQAVRRIVEGDGEVEAQAPTVKIINLSLGDGTRPFIHTPSPWARLLDWLSWKYRVLFCVSAGNYLDPYDFDIPYSEYQLKSDEEKTDLLLEAMQNSLSERRLLAPAESINAITVGALHQDESGNNYYLAHRVDLLPGSRLLSPISRLGHGFRRSVKPEIYFPGGRQLYNEPVSSKNSEFRLNEALHAPGQKVARDSESGELSREVFSRGTSNATALATRAGVQIHEVLEQLNTDNQIPDNLIAVLIKTLLVHGSIQDRDTQQAVGHLKHQDNSRQFKTVLARYLGYGVVDVGRVLGCIEQRGTVVGFGEIDTNELHEYHFPIPDEFSGQGTFRRMVVTLAWFSPINPRHRYLREAKLEIQPESNWNETALKLARTDGDHHQVKRGAVQHEVLEGRDQLAAFQQNEQIVLRVLCKKDATEKLEERIPYGLAVTLEAAEESQIPVYQRIRDRLSVPVGVTSI